MYLHARQFPHLQGKTDSEIRLLMFQGLEREPKYRTIRRLRTVVVLLGMVAGVAVLVSVGVRIGLSLMIVGGVATAVVLLFNLVWVNTVVFRLTQEELNRGI
jgi:hypothetical protein